MEQRAEEETPRPKDGGEMSKAITETPSAAAMMAAEKLTPKGKTSVEQRWRSVDVKKNAAIIDAEFKTLIQAAEKAMRVIDRDIPHTKKVCEPGIARQLRAALAKVKGEG